MSHLKDTQKNPADTNVHTLPPHEYYNRYIRKEGQKVLTEQDYKKMFEKNGKTLNKDKDASTGT